jgi:hypothetical protein
MKNYKSYQIIYYCIITGKGSKIIIADNKSNANKKLLINKPHVKIIDCINISN